MNNEYSSFRKLTFISRDLFHLNNDIYGTILPALNRNYSYTGLRSITENAGRKLQSSKTKRRATFGMSNAIPDDYFVFCFVFVFVFFFFFHFIIIIFLNCYYYIVNLLYFFYRRAKRSDHGRCIFVVRSLRC